MTIVMQMSRRLKMTITINSKLKEMKKIITTINKSKVRE